MNSPYPTCDPDAHHGPVLWENEAWEFRRDPATGVLHPRPKPAAGRTVEQRAGLLRRALAAVLPNRKRDR